MASAGPGVGLTIIDIEAKVPSPQIFVPFTVSVPSVAVAEKFIVGVREVELEINAPVPLYVHT